MPVTTTNNRNTVIGISVIPRAVRLTIEDIEREAKECSEYIAYPTFSSFLNHLKNKNK
jgi:hypothetical protein